MRSLVLASGLLLATAACGSPEPRADATASGGRASRADAEAADRAAPPPPSIAPSAAAPAPATRAAEADFTGVWAIDAEHCARGETWRFASDRMEANDEASCALEGAARTSEGWALQATCTDDGPPAAATLTLTRTEDGHGLTVSGGPFAASPTLSRCTPPTTIAAG